MAAWHVPFYDGFYERFSSVWEIYRQITGCLSTSEHEAAGFVLGCFDHMLGQVKLDYVRLGSG